jgi:hypothetical protein
VVELLRHGKAVLVLRYVPSGGRRTMADYRAAVSEIFNNQILTIVEDVPNLLGARHAD